MLLHHLTKKYLNKLFVVLALGVFFNVQAQEIPFSPRLDDGGNTFVNIKGDYTFLSNTVMNRRTNTRGPNDPYNGTRSNNNFHIEYIDIDGDPSTFSSTSSTLNLPDCSQIFYAGLYWAGNYDRDVVNSRFTGDLPNDNNRYDFTQIKFRMPGGAYLDIQADNAADPAGEEDEIIIDGFGTVANSPYVCYRDVTSLLQSLADPTGEYFVGNVRGTRGRTSYGVGGWTLVVIFENPTLTGKYISTFDGYEGVTTQTTADRIADISVMGFNTIPVGPVNARIGVSVLEGESNLTGDQFQIQTPLNPGFTNLSNAANPSTNFFNSSISIDGANVTSRNINGTNSMGYDSDIFDINNPANSIIENEETDATLRLTTSSDWFASFLVTFGVDIIEPDILLEKRVEDIAGNDITGMGVNLGQTLEYVLSFANRGNDDATGYTIRDVLPLNVTLDESNFVLPPGVTYTYDPAIREVVFSIPDNLIEEGDPFSSIRMRVQVAENCFDFVDACTDLIENIAFSTYEGVINDNQISDDPSVSNFDNCGFVTPGATNFLLDDLSACNFTRTVQLCGDDVVLDAGDNFDDYIWVLDTNGNNLIDPTDTVINDGDPDGDPSTILVDDIGTYIVDKIVADPCKGFQEIIIVERFGNTQTSPIIDLFNTLNSDSDPFNDIQGEIVTCSIDGDLLPKIFLCGTNDSQLLQVNIPDADSIEWEQLDEASCPPAGDDCANKDGSCSWNTVATGTDFDVNNPGKYRLVINYANGCSSRFFFNVFQNLLDVQYNASDIICTTPGNITITNLGNGYGYQLVNTAAGTIDVPFSANNGPSFTINNNGAYRVEVVQLDAVTGDPIPGACIFSTDEIGIRDRDFQVDIDTKDTDCNGLGEISISVLNVEAQYYFEISQGGTTVDTHGPINDNNFTFENLNDGIYDVLVTTDDGCSYTEQVTINDASDLALSARIIQQITCEPGSVQMDATGGATPYNYAIWTFVDDGGVTQISYPTVSDIPGSAYQNVDTFEILNPGEYTFVVVDGNNCSAFSNTVTIVVEPAVEFTSAAEDESCFGAEDGSITYNVTAFNGYSVAYTLTRPDTTTDTNSSGIFTDLAQGEYTVTLTQTRGTAVCDFTETFTISGPIDGVSATSALTQDYTCLQEGIIEAQNVTGGTAPYEYSIDGVTFVSGPGAEQFTNLTNGTYTITVRDAEGCTVVTSPITIDPLNEPSDLTFTATSPSCPALTADVTLAVVDGNTPFTYEIIAPAANAVNNGTTATFSGLAPGTYTFRVTDDKGCAYDEDYTITPVAPIEVVGQLVSNISCLGATDGELLYTVSGFNTSYDYAVTGPAAFNGTAETNTTIPLNGLASGTYTITVTDTDTSCTATTNVTIAAPAAALTLTIDETQPTCTAQGSVLLTGVDGWGGYSYEITYPDGTTTDTNSSGSFTGLSQNGSYTVSVTDANDCVVTDTFELNAAIAPVLEIVANDECFDPSAGLSLTANVTSGGDGNFEYSLNGASFAATNVFLGLAPGTYTIDVRDGNSCTASASITIDPELTLTASSANITACGTTTDVTITAAGGDNNFVYAIVADGATPAATDFAANNVITVSAAGDYDIYVRDNSGNTDFCEAFIDFSIAQDAPLSVSISDNGIQCSGFSQAELSITPTGGQAPYEYSIDNGATYQTANTFSNLAAGSYNIRVRDFNNCDVAQIYTISEPFTLSASAGVTELVECNPTAGAEVRITNAQGGTMPYSYSFDGGVTYGTSNISFLLPGTYDLFIQDSLGCTFAMNLVVPEEITTPDFTANVSYDCDGDGTITVNSSNTTDFDYTYEINSTPNTPDTSNIFTDVPVGTHTVTINYTPSAAPAPSDLLFENFGSGPNTSILEIDPAYCYEPQDGSVRACDPGTPTRINDGEYSVTQVISLPFGSWLSPNDHTGNPGGRFLAINVGGVAGLNGIIYAKRNIEVLPNRDITISLEAFNLLRSGTGGGDPNIEIELVNSLGTIIASTATGNIPKNNGEDDWQNYTVTLNPGAETTLDIVIRTNSTVTGGNDIAIDDIRAFQTPLVCSLSEDITVVVEDGNAFEANITNFTAISCNAAADGTITFEVENFDTVNGFAYAVNGGAFSAPQTSSPITINGLAPGTVNIEVRDVVDNTCSVSLSQAINEPTPIVASANITTDFTCNNTGATITASGSGGTPAYEYQLEDNVGGVITAYQTATTFTNVGAGDYIVRVRDTRGCNDPIDAAITIIAPNNPTFTATPTACYSGANDASIFVDVTSIPGNGGFQFSLDGGPWITPTPATATSHTFTNLTNGTYTIDVRDGFGCAAPQQVVVINAQLTASAILNTDLTCLAAATATITANGGSGTYVYEWSNDAGATYNTTDFTGNVFSTTTGGTYIFRITDTTAPAACSVVTAAIVVTPADLPVINAVAPTDVLCNGDVTGALDVDINTAIGRPPYTIEVIETISGTNYGTQTTGLPAGSYSVTITDDKGCVSAAVTATISQPDAITYDIDLQPITCDTTTGTNPGSITVENLAGGVAEYTYFLTGNNGFSDSYTTTSGGEDHTFAILEFGIYEVDVVDINGCSLRTTNIIASPPDDLDIDVSATTVDCLVGGTAVVTVTTAILGTNYEFAILETFAVPYSSTYFAPDVAGGATRTFTGLVPGITYTFVVHDITTDCYYFETAATPVNSPSNLTNTLDVVNNITCTGAADGNVSFTFDNYDAGATAVNYEIFNAQSNITTGFTGSAAVNPPTGAISVTNFATLPQGVYYILFSEVGGAFNGCSVSSPDFTITESTNLLTVTANSPENDNCNPNEGVITALAQFGTAPYEFQYLLSTDPAPTAASASWVFNTSENVESGDYIVYVKDANDCIQSDAVTVALDPSPEISLSVVDECVDEGAFEVLVTLDQAGVTPYLLSVNGGAFQNITFVAGQYTVSGLSSGAAQTIEIRDLNGCGESENFTIQPPLQFNAQLSTLLDCEVAPANNAEITIEVTAGSGTYEYEIDGPGAVDQARVALPSVPFTWNLASAAGNYSVTVYDTSTAIPNCLGTITVNVPAAVAPVFTETHIDVSCNGGTNGSITLNETDNGINPLTYTIAPVAGTFNAATNTFENLPAGTYTITGTGTNDCVFDISNILIDEPNVISVPTITVVEFECATGNNSNNATITIDDTAVTGGSGTYTVFEFVNDQGTPSPLDDVIVQTGANTVYTETNTSGGTYIINVYDNNGCVGSATATINAYDELQSATVAVIDPISCSNAGEDIQIEATGSLSTSTTNPANYEYRILPSGTFQASNAFNDLAIGTHVFEVRNVNTGCLISVSHLVSDPNTFDIDVNKLSDVICFGTETGEVTLAITDATYASGFDWTIFDTNGTPTDILDDVVYKSGNSATTGPTAAITLVGGEYRVEITQTAFPDCTNATLFTIASPSAAITANTTITPITCVGNDGIIEIIDVLGGWGNYSYYVGTGAPTGAGDFVAGTSFNSLAPGTYEAWVIDGEGCQQMVQNGIVLADPTPITASLQINQENCTNLQGEIEVVSTAGGQGSNYTYQLIRDGVVFGAPQNTTVFSGLGAGSYEVQITDQWTCTTTIGPEVLFEEILLTSTVVKLLDCTSNPDGEITINVNGGSTNLDFTVTFPDGITTANNTTGVFTGLSQAGTYSFEVTDLDTTNPVCTETITAELIAPTPITFDTHTIVDVSCNGGSDGRVTINLSSAAGANNNPPYTYNLYDGGVLIAGPQNDPLFDGLAAGSYEVEAISDRGCSLREVIIIEEPTELLIDASATAFVCNTANTVNTATITVTILDGATTPGVLSGTGPYLYSIDNLNFQTGNTFDIIDTGVQQTIDVFVQDANGCPQDTQVILDPVNTFTVTVAQDAAITCVGPEQVTVTVADNGDPTNAYTFELLPLGNPNGALTGTPTNITATYDLTAVGSYTFRVTDNATGCYVDTAPYEILPFDTIEVAAVAVDSVVCFGDTNGSLEITVSGYTGNYTYEVFDGAGVTTGITGSANTSTNPFLIGGLSGGNYTVTVTESDALSTLCDAASNTITILSPDMPLTAVVNEGANVTCTNDQGEIFVDPSGGYAPYDIVLTNTTTAAVFTQDDVQSTTFSGLAEGNYTVVITDDNGCVINDTQVLTRPTPITADISPDVTLSCFGDATATVSALNVLNGRGAGNYAYQLNFYDATGTTIEFTTGAQSSDTFMNIGEGIYSITVSDGWNCDVETAQMTVTAPTEVEVSLIQATNATCANQPMLTLTATGGDGNYEFSEDGITWTPLPSNPYTFAVVADDANPYQYFVRDGQQCASRLSNAITANEVVMLALTIANFNPTVSCNGENTGNIMASATGGLGGYVYELFDDPAMIAAIDTNGTGAFFNRGAGDYYVRVTSVDCIETSSVITISEPVPLVVTDSFTNVTCAGLGNGTITVELSGGSGGYQYAISPNLDQFDTINTFEDLEAGTYTVIAQDINGCFEQLEYTIIEPVALAATATATPEVCVGEEDGTVTVEITGGTAPYSTAIDSNDDADFVQDQLDFADLASGTHVVFVRDAQGCETNVFIEVEAGANINATVTPVYECTGDTPNNFVNITLEDDSVIGDVLYALDSTDPNDLQLNADFRDTPPGDHFITIVHANGCMNTIDFVIEDFQPLTLVLEQNNINEITAVATGGSENYTFHFDGENNGTDNTYVINRTDTYEVTVTDENGCEVTAFIPIEFIDIEIPNFFTPDGDGLNDFWVPRNQEAFPQILTIIFDRYGREVYRMGLNDQGWNGLYQNSELPTGDYWYIIKLNGENDDRELVGHFTLYR